MMEMERSKREVNVYRIKTNKTCLFMTHDDDMMIEINKQQQDKTYTHIYWNRV